MDSFNRSNMPCAACKYLRRRCTQECIFLPYFPPKELEKFAAVHRIFGASNISKLLQEIPVNDREDAVTSMVYEATARLKNPVYGCVSLIASLQKQVFELQAELNAAHAEAIALRTKLSDALSTLHFFGVPTSTKSFEGENKHGFHYHQPPGKCDNYADDYDAMLLLPQHTDSYQATDIVFPDHV